jgi:Ca2+-binding EF-hand superfamily protein
MSEEQPETAEGAPLTPAPPQGEKPAESRPAGGLVPKEAEHVPNPGSTPKAAKEIANAQAAGAAMSNAAPAPAKPGGKGPRRMTVKKIEGASWKAGLRVCFRVYDPHNTGHIGHPEMARAFEEMTGEKRPQEEIDELIHEKAPDDKHPEYVDFKTFEAIMVANSRAPKSEDIDFPDMNIDAEAEYTATEDVPEHVSKTMSDFLLGFADEDMISDMLEEQIAEEENLSEDTFQDLRQVLKNKRLLVEAFQMWDQGKKGSIDLADCRRMVMLSEEGGITGDDADDLADSIMNDVDTNGDGVIDFREFCKAFDTKVAKDAPGGLAAIGE